MNLKLQLVLLLKLIKNNLFIIGVALRSNFKYAILVFCAICNLNIFAQEDINDEGNLIEKNISISGNIEAYGESYITNNFYKRRPNLTGRLFFRPTINLFDLIQIPFEFLLSTEGNSARQNINQYGINPKWSWISLNVGDFSTEYSKYTLSGTLIRGGGISLTPGLFRFSTAAGFTRRAVQEGAQDGSFKRFLFASKIGFGNEAKNFLDIIFVRAKDEVSSNEVNSESITLLTPNGNDILAIGDLIAITWNSFGFKDGVRIEISRDGGNSFEIIADNQPNVSYYNWTVNGPNTFEGIIKVTSIEDSSVFDINEGLISIGTGVETSISNNTNTIINQKAVTPQENLVMGAKAKISFLNNIFSFDFDAAGSIYTRDLRASAVNIDSTEFPNFISKIYRPRVGTNYDFAYNAALSIKIKTYSGKIGYKRIQPGYYSLGAAFLQNDIQEYSIQNNFRISVVGINLSYIRQNDNIANQKLFTTYRNIITSGISAKITNNWMLNISGNILLMKNNSDVDSTLVDFNNYSINLSNSFNINPKSLLKNINLNYSFQSSDNKSYLLKNNSTFIHNLNLGFGFGLSESLNSNLITGFTNSSIFDTIKTFTHNYGLNFQHRAFNNKLNSSLNFSLVFSKENQTHRASISSGYNLTDADAVNLTISFMRFNGRTYRGGSFNELITSLNYNHIF